MIDQETTGIHISLPAKAENIALIRHALTGVAETLGMDEIGIGDLKTIVTEACTNVVVHAYEDGGPLDVRAFPEEGVLTVVVSDHGRGIQPRADLEHPSLRLGLSLIAALSASFDIKGRNGQGTEVTMRVPIASNSEPPQHLDGVAGADQPEAALLESADRQLMEVALGRMVRSVGARRDLSIDRLSDMAMVTDAIADEARGLSGDSQVRVSITESDDGLQLRLGPLRGGAGDRLHETLRIPGIDGSLESLTDLIKTDETAVGTFISLEFRRDRDNQDVRRDRDNQDA